MRSLKTKLVPWLEINSTREEDLSKAETWKQKLRVESGPGIYVYRAHRSIAYPFKESCIVYIGKSKNLASRLARHFGTDMKSRLLKDWKTLEWFYQNYYLEKIPFDIVWTLCNGERLEDIERLLIGMFSAEHGAMPLCNSSIQRRKLKETYRKFRNTGELKVVENLLRKVESV